jgi:hypothetical protein
MPKDAERSSIQPGQLELPGRRITFKAAANGVARRLLDHFMDVAPSCGFDGVDIR